LYEHGKNYEQGQNGISQHYTKALLIFDHAFDLNLNVGDAETLLHVAHFLENEGNYKKSLHYFNSLAEKNNLAVLLMLANNYISPPSGFEKNLLESSKYFNKIYVSDQNNKEEYDKMTYKAFARARLISFYLKGIKDEHDNEIIKMNKEEAFKLLEEGIQENCDICKTGLAQWHIEGTHMPQDDNKALELLESVNTTSYFPSISDYTQDVDPSNLLDSLKQKMKKKEENNNVQNN
jgi:TPR repeat protein